MRAFNLSCLFCLFSLHIVIAQFSFEGPMPLHESMATNIYSFIGADIDSDGDQDIVYSSLSNFQIVWAENKYGIGGFETKHLVDYNVAVANSIVAADLDGDDDIDLITASRHGRNVIWYENLNGKGQFSQPHIVAQYYDPLRVAAVDFDNDGDLDILLANCYDRKSLLWFKNTDGRGTFVEQSPVFEDNEAVRHVFAHDFDHDGDLDIVTIFDSGSVIWFENSDGKGQFRIASTLLEKVWRTLAIADVNNDGFDDIVFPREKDLFLVKGKADLTFTAPELIYDFSYDGSRDFDLHFVDLDNDHDFDIVAVLNHSNVVVWFENKDGKGSFGKEQKILAMDYVELVYPSDFDGDGLIDVAVTGGENGLVWCKLLDRDGTFSLPKEITFTTSGIFQTCSGDIDGDEDTDVVVSASGSLFLFENSDGYEVFDRPKSISDASSSFGDLHLLDIDGDSDLDVFTDLGWFENKGENIFSHHEFWARTGQPLLIFDFDGDNDLDFIMLEFNMCYVNQYGRGDFVAIENIFPFASERWFNCSAVDIDSDGDKDILGQMHLSGINGWRYVWSQNLGNGIFSEQIVIPIEEKYLFVPLLADIDSDGDKDIYALNYNSRRIVWYENQDGQGDFALPKKIDCPDDIEVSKIYPATDLDQDGDDDIVFLGPTAEQHCYVLENKGVHNTFALQKIIHAPIYRAIENLHFADINSDGKIDILNYDLFPPRLTWYKNMDTTGITRREGRPKPPLTHHVLYQNFPNPFNPKTIFAYDLVSDGFVTLSIYNLRGQKVSTLVNEYQQQGFHFTEWKPTNNAAGLYFGKLSVGNFSQIIKLLYQK